MILCWNEGQSSAIHDHSDSHCFLKVLKGSLMEIKYVLPKEESSISNKLSVLEPSVSAVGIYHDSNEENVEQNGQPLQELSRTTVYENQVCYINGKTQLITTDKGWKKNNIKF